MAITGTIDCDVLIIGAGNAGLRAGVEAARNKAHVVILSKSPFPGGSTVVAGGVMQASFERGWYGALDTKAVHFKDTIEGGAYINDQVLVRVLVDEAPKRVFDLEDMGVTFERATPTQYEQIRAGGYSVERAVEAGRNDEVMRALYDEARRLGVQVYDEVIVTKLLASADGPVLGATGVDIKKGEFVVCRAKATILAAGALGRLFKITATTRNATGDGFALAWRASRNRPLQLVNMEMIQFIPLAYVYPEFIRGFTLGEAGSYPGVHFLNTLGERYMQKYDPRLERATRDVNARGAYIEIKEGRGTPRGGILVDVTKVNLKDAIYSPYRRADRWRLIRDFYGEECAWYRKPLEAAPSALYECGGVKINEQCETGLDRLFAAGEVAANIHGANRLIGNSLIELQVYGARAGRYAAERAQKAPLDEIKPVDVEIERKRVFDLLERKDGIRPVKVKKTLQNLLWDKVNLTRNAGELKEALAEVVKMKKDIPGLCVTSNTTRYNYEWQEGLEVDMMLDVAEMVIRSALFRGESRGTHFRTDFPYRNDKGWLRETTIINKDGEMFVSSQPIRITEIFPPETPSGAV